ncbi:hypothetical protein U1Q18_021152 [Sarracenia purpurea var. burkii]
MANTAITEMPTINNPGLARKGRNKKAMKPIISLANEANIAAAAGMISQHSPTAIVSPLEDSVGKENHESLSQSPPRKLKRNRKRKSNLINQYFDKEWQKKASTVEA